VTRATIALRVGRAVLPAYRRTWSIRRCTQPQLLAMLCLMRYGDWTFREAEACLTEHGAVHAALGLHGVPGDTTMYRFLRRLEAAALGQASTVVIQRLISPLGGPAKIDFCHL
jgi:hypothetical protein